MHSPQPTAPSNPSPSFEGFHDHLQLQLPKHLLLRHIRLPPQRNKIRLLALAARRVGFDPVDFLEEAAQPLFQERVLGARVEFRQEVAAGGQGGVAEVEGGEAEVLLCFWFCY